MTGRPDDPGPGPARLFLELWERAAQWTNAQRSVAPEPRGPFVSMCEFVLMDDHGAKIEAKLRRMLIEGAPTEPEEQGRVLAVMRAIDQACYAVHSRAVVSRATSGSTRTLPHWLRDLRAFRRRCGDYGISGNRRLIPRGPLLREGHGPTHDFAESLFNRFAALSVAPLSLTHQDRDIPLAMRIVDGDAWAGVRSAHNPGAESVGFIPLAVEPGELEATAKWREERLFVEYKPAAILDVEDEARTALAGLGFTDCVVMPELALAPHHADQIAALLGTHSVPLPRVVVAGSCLTEEQDDGLPWNEARIFNHGGVELWRQRKLWPAGINASMAADFGLPSPGEESIALEYTASGSEIVIADIDQFGRCLVLICQDLHLAMVTQLLEAYQPDWVFVPILDRSIDEGRWAHSASFAQSGRSQARFIAITSTCFGGHYNPRKPGGMGLAVGPRDPAHAPEAAPQDLGRAVSLVPRPKPGEPRYARIEWRDGDWEQSKLGKAPPGA